MWSLSRSNKNIDIDKNITEMVEYYEKWLVYCWYYWNVEKDHLQVVCNWKLYFSSICFLISASIFVVSINWSMKKETVQDLQLLAKNSTIVIKWIIIILYLNRWVWQNPFIVWKFKTLLTWLVMGFNRKVQCF